MVINFPHLMQIMMLIVETVQIHLKVWIFNIYYMYYFVLLKKNSLALFTKVILIIEEYVQENNF